MPVSQVKPEALASLPTSTTGGPAPSAFGQAYQAASEAAWGTVEEQKQKASQAFKVRARVGAWRDGQCCTGRAVQLLEVGLSMQPCAVHCGSCEACRIAKRQRSMRSFLPGRKAGGGAAPAAAADQGGQ